MLSPHRDSLCPNRYLRCPNRDARCTAPAAGRAFLIAPRLRAALRPCLPPAVRQNRLHRLPRL
eukprot:855812-Rhodomonas_salina.1